MTPPRSLPPPRVRRFDGETIDHRRDKARLSSALDAVYAVLGRGGWWTLERLRASVRGLLLREVSEGTVSARIRDLRKARFGGHEVRHRRREDGLWEYRLVVLDR